MQTWHGPQLKKIAQDIDIESYSRVKEEWKKDASYWDYFISSTPEISSILKIAFDIQPEIMLETGYPRNDRLLSHTSDDKTFILNEIGIPKHKKILLYAPTFRDDEVDEFKL